MALVRVDGDYIKVRDLTTIKKGEETSWMEKINPEALEAVKVYREDIETLRCMHKDDFGGLVVKIMQVKLDEDRYEYSIVFAAIDDESHGNHQDMFGKWVIMGCPASQRDVKNKASKFYATPAELANHVFDK